MASVRPKDNIAMIPVWPENNVAIEIAFPSTTTLQNPLPQLHTATPNQRCKAKQTNWKNGPGFS
jgi:hypothetical protein